MKWKLLLAIVLILCFTQMFLAQTEPKRYQYHIWGNVIDEHSRPMIGILVCFIPAVRPIQGRIPCTKMDDEGDYAFTVTDVPDKYTITATTSKDLMLVDKNTRYVSTGILDFGTEDECRHIVLQIKPK